MVQSSIDQCIRACSGNSRRKTRPAAIRSTFDVTRQTTAPAAYQGDVEVGRPVDGPVSWQNVPNYPKYHWAHLNNERVVVDDSHNVVAVYTD